MIHKSPDNPDAGLKLPTGKLRVDIFTGEGTGTGVDDADQDANLTIEE